MKFNCHGAVWRDLAVMAFCLAALVRAAMAQDLELLRFLSADSTR